MRNIKRKLSFFSKGRLQTTRYKTLYGCCFVLMSLWLNSAFAAEAPSGEGGLLALLGIDPKTIIIQVIGFLVVLAVLWKFVFGKVGGLLEERRIEVTTQSEQLRTDREELDRLTAETRQGLADIETEAQAKIQAAIEQGNVERQQILVQARQEADDEVARARAEIQREKDEAISELRGVVAELAIDAASKIISAELNAERHQHIIDASISRLPTE